MSTASVKACLRARTALSTKTVTPSSLVSRMQYGLSLLNADLGSVQVKHATLTLNVHRSTFAGTLMLLKCKQTLRDACFCIISPLVQLSGGNTYPLMTISPIPYRMGKLASLA